MLTLVNIRSQSRKGHIWKFVIVTNMAAVASWLILVVPTSLTEKVVVMKYKHFTFNE